MRPTQEELEERNILKSKSLYLFPLMMNNDREKIPTLFFKYYFKAKFKRKFLKNKKLFMF